MISCLALATAAAALALPVTVLQSTPALANHEWVSSQSHLQALQKPKPRCQQEVGASHSHCCMKEMRGNEGYVALCQQGQGSLCICAMAGWAGGDSSVHAGRQQQDEVGGGGIAARLIGLVTCERTHHGAPVAQDIHTAVQMRQFLTLAS